MTRWDINKLNRKYVRRKQITQRKTSNYEIYLIFWKIIHLKNSNNLLSSTFFRYMLALLATTFYIFRSLSFDLKITPSLSAFLIILCISERVSSFSIRAHGLGQLSAQHPVFVHESLLPRKVSSSWSETHKVHTFTSGARPRRTFQLR